MDNDEELELLLSFQGVPETPPGSPSRTDFKGEKDRLTQEDDELLRNPTANLRATLQECFGYESDEDLPNPKANMDAFRGVLKPDSYKLSNDRNPSAKQPLTSLTNNRIETEVHSGLRIRDRTLTSIALSNMLSDLRFLPLQAIRNVTRGEKNLGAWATIGVLAEKGAPRVSSNGKNFAIWKIASLDTATMSVFLFGDAYTQHYKEDAGCISAILNAKVRYDEKRNELTLSIFTKDQFVKLGKSVDYCICKGTRKDGTPCSVVVNKRQGEYCSVHANALRQKYKSKRAELKGGNLATGLSFLHKPKNNQTSTLFDDMVDAKPEKRVKYVSVKGLKNILNNADKVTTKFQSQGIRFLASLTDVNDENKDPKSGKKRQNTDNNLPVLKRSKIDKENIQPSEDVRNGKQKGAGGMIELDFDEGPDNSAMRQAAALFSKGGQL